LAANHTRYRHRDELAGGTGLRLHPIREHYIVFEPLSKNQIVVVAVLRRGRDIPEILSRGHHLIVRELEAFRDHKKDGQ
jgi:plasmid stabilization system protein ParE